ncbi:MAG: hypothetical protein A2Z20_02680 [Bdellovibrionales bacterium RBG_16_40_8]|nr:MAG: hypothetical protein A2Z20_02680 [Bdellovibrionales bacterium RBG_16_40_8]
MALYEIEEADQFLKDVEEAAVWILITNLEQSESLANKKVNDLKTDLDSLRERLRSYPESGEAGEVPGLRRFPIYEGRYSAKWIVIHSARLVTLVALSDSKYPRQLRQFHIDDDE